MEYTEVDFKAGRDEADMIIAVLGDEFFEMFEEHDSGVKGYIASENFSGDLLKEILTGSKFLSHIEYTIQTIEDKNWNEEWEKNFAPVFIQNRIYVRAPFHKTNPDAEYELMIEPKMAFGTGHHATTSLMLQHLLELDVTGLSVLDVGCGSGILSVFVSKRGALKITALDIDEWSCRNTIENCELNHVSNVTTLQGDAALINEKIFDVLIANINRNVILTDADKYFKGIRNGGHLLVSGFLLEDESKIREGFARFNLTELSVKRERGWSSIHFKKKENA